MMDFPAYVPAAVRAHITTLIAGDSWELMGSQESLASAERQLAEIDGKIEGCIRWEKDDYLRYAHATKTIQQQLEGGGKVWSLKAIIKVSPLLMSLFVPSAQAENWAAIGVASTNNQTLYVDRDSIEREGSFARFWIKVGIEKHLLSFNAYTDSIEQVVLNCVERTFAVTKILGVRSNGERVSRKEVDPAALSFAKVVDTSPVSNHWSQFCPEKVASVQPPQPSEGGCK